jgi:heat shock protein HtpX
VEPASPSLRGRIALAIVLTVAFYALALAIAAGLVAGPLVLRAQTGFFNLWLALALWLGALAVLRGIVPRRTPWVDPGPRVTREAQPELFAVLDDVATRVGDRPADEVHLAADAGASVAERGGPRGRRRVLVLGLALLQALDVEELRAVVAHEHGHVVGGDMTAARWVWRTRAAIGRTIASVEAADRVTLQIIAAPFDWYGRLYLRVTNAVSRREELAADARAAAATGPDAHRRALLASRRAALAFDAYLADDLEPALAGGVRPPIHDGLARFLAAPEVIAWLDATVAEMAAQAPSSPYDTHPTLPDRLAVSAAGEGAPPRADAPHAETPRAAAPPAAATPRADAPPAAALSRADTPPAPALSHADTPPAAAPRAITLLHDLDGLETALLTRPDALRRVAWEDVGAEATLPALRAYVAAHASVLGDLRVVDAAHFAEHPRELEPHLFPDDPPAGEQEHLAAAAIIRALLADAVIVALAAEGWAIAALPGEPVRLTRDDDRSLAPLPALIAIGAGDADVPSWEATCDHLGIGELRLAPPRAGAGDAQADAADRTARFTHDTPDSAAAPEGAAGDDPQSLAGTGR